jgi:hypothetical protein
MKPDVSLSLSQKAAFDEPNESSPHFIFEKSDWGTLVPRINVENVYITN